MAVYERQQENWMIVYYCWWMITHSIARINKSIVFLYSHFPCDSIEWNRKSLFFLLPFLLRRQLYMYCMIHLYSDFRDFCLFVRFALLTLIQIQLYEPNVNFRIVVPSSDHRGHGSFNDKKSFQWKFQLKRSQLPI